MLISTRLRISLEQEITALLAAFQEVNLAVIPLKGAHLSALVYAEPALRPVDDIDLLVKIDDLLAADRVMTRLGYGPSRVGWINGGYTAAHHHLPPYTRPNSYPIEVHWTITHPSSGIQLSPDEVWQRAQPANIYHFTVSLLTPVDLLLHICIHACHEDLFAGGMRPLVDVSELLTRTGSDLDWDALIERAGLWRAHKCLYLVLYLVDQLLGCSPPAGVLDSFRPQGASPAILDSARQSVLQSERLSPHFARMWGQAGFRSKSSNLLRRLFLPPGDMYRKYAVEPGSVQFYLAYLARLKELSLRYAGQSWRIWRGQSDQAAASANTNLLSEWLHEN